jgi:putative oxidoreductase
MLELFVIGRILVGVYFILSGTKHFTGLEGMTGYAKAKGLPMAREGVLLSGLLMLLGGLGILLGVMVTYSIFALVLFLVVSAFQMHQFWKAEGMARMGEEINFKKNLALAGTLLMMLAIPLPWYASLMM